VSVTTTILRSYSGDEAPALVTLLTLTLNGVSVTLSPALPQAFTAVDANSWAFAFAGTPGATYAFTYRLTWDDEETDDLSGTIVASGAAGDAYLSVAEADTLAATLPALAQWPAASSGDKAKALQLATIEIDVAMPYQGERYDTAQLLEFPRRDGARIIDWDSEANQAVVPPNVKLATLLQAEEVLTSGRLDRLSKVHQGIVYDQTAGMAESFKGGGEAGLRTMLSIRAYQIMRRYALRSGRLL
jgi:hypothetical protein